MKIAHEWQDYELLDMGSGEKLERWKDIILIRPDPQIIWSDKNNISSWNQVHAHYHRSNQGGGSWELKKKVPESWFITYRDLKFKVKLMGFKHTGLFPEQAVNWDFMIAKIKKANRPIKVLNLFAYTGASTVACSYAGAIVCHVDSSKGMITLAKENLKLSNLGHNEVRFIHDDVIKFVKREIRRGHKYDCIIMDPPSFGRGTSGEVWTIEKELTNLIVLCSELLSATPLFFLISSYTKGLSSYVISNLLELYVNSKYQGIITSGELGLPVTNSKLILPCGIYSRWESK